MTGNDVLDQAVKLLDLRDANGDLANRTLPVINMIYYELARIEGKEESSILPIESRADEIDLSKRTLQEVMPLGVAAMIALQNGDTLNQSVYAQMYEEKKRKIVRIADRTDVWGAGQ